VAEAPDRPRRGAHFPFAASFGLEHAELTGAVFAARVVERGFPFVLNDGWTTQAKSFESPGMRLLTSASAWGRAEIVDTGDAIISVSLQMGHASVVVAAETEDRAGELVRLLREQLPAPDPSGRQEVTVTFWTYGPHGPQPSWRTISVPQWSEIEHNYGQRVRSSLEPLMTQFRPAAGGQLVLWHGESGTGKTFALRALAWEWREWCDVHYVVDPDSFFGEHADYLMHVLLQSEAETMGWTSYGGIHTIRMTTSAEAPEVDEDAPTERRGKDWRLLVLEDTGELLQPDAKAVIGQGLGRFLNLVDGLIGQGLRVLVLVTTNEEIRKLHPAVARPGRCAADITFERLTGLEADAWLSAHELPPSDRGQTIAELYARLAGTSGAVPSERFAPKEGS